MKNKSEHSKKLREEMQKRFDEKEGVSLNEAASMLEIHRSTLYRYIDEGFIKKVYQGKSPKILLTEIYKFKGL